jgi:tetraprenyl-beta-curcumene synthase
VARAALALGLANLRYWTSVAPVARGELRRWERRAQAIEDRELRALALEKLRGEGFHAEAAAMMATLAPRPHRADAVRAIVALELLFDYLDGLTERPSADPLGDGARLFAAYTDALSGGSETNDGSYLWALSDAAGEALRRLPAASAIAEVALASARRSAQAQTRMHAAGQLGAEQVERWARGEADGTGLTWRELLAGAASSVLAVHALIAAAADPDTTRAQAGEIERGYLQTCVLLTLLDGLVDHEEDRADRREERGYIDLYEDRDELARTLTDATRRAAGQVRALPNGPHHAMTLVGVVAYYTSAPGARGRLARPIVTPLQRQLAPLIFPALWLMRTWRLAKHASNRRTRRSGGLASFLGQPRGREGCNEI